MKHLLLVTMLIFTLSYSVVVGNHPFQRLFPIKQQSPALVVDLEGKVGDNTKVSQQEIECLTETIIREAGSDKEGLKGKILVAQTVINRINNPQFKDDACSVVNRKIKGVCQFEFKCSVSKNNYREHPNYPMSREIAQNALEGKYKGYTKALWFKKCSTESKFFDKLKFLGRHQGHCFYINY